MHNTLLPIILSLLREHAAGVSEYDLMQMLAEYDVFNDFSDASQLALFQKHFMIMNALYELQQQLWEDEQLYLEVSPLNIEIKAANQSTSEEHSLILSESEELSCYYRDWQNFEDTDEAAVIGLLNNFWQRYISIDKKESALEILELKPDAEHEEIVASYRRLAAKHHPDKGGEKEIFIKVRQAYEVLKI